MRDQACMRPRWDVTPRTYGSRYGRARVLSDRGATIADPQVDWGRRPVQILDPARWAYGLRSAHVQSTAISIAGVHSASIDLARDYAREVLGRYRLGQPVDRDDALFAYDLATRHEHAA